MATNNITNVYTNEASDRAPLDLSGLTQKYEEEKQKRLRADGANQYVDLESTTSSHLATLIEDPWVDHATLNTQKPNLENGDEIKFLILGAGFGGLMYGAQFVEAGFKPEEIRLVDVAGGFGGTWYWNRYPGLHCDSESSIYLPLLEETGYIPKQRYSRGNDIRLHAERIAEKWGLKDQGVFRTQMETFTWDDTLKRWIVTMKQNRGPHEQAVDMTVRAQFVVLANGLLNHPKAPKIEGLESFQGSMIHTGRWKFDVSGGSPTDWALHGLKGKKIGFLGTGATGVQCVPELSKYAGELFVFQRTPSGVDQRDQKDLDTKAWEEVTNNNSKGWWQDRNANYAGWCNGERTGNNLVNDAWTTIETYHVLTGGPHENPLSMEEVPGHIGRTLAMDAPRNERLRKRVEELVTVKETAAKLKAWYPSWCKRPCFHDEYLQTYNLPNVTLVQTEPAGVEKATSKGLVVDGKEYQLDVLIFGTGYRSPVEHMQEPSNASNATITGRNGVTLSQKWLSNGPATLHGCFTNNFPNLILTGPAQASASPSITYLFDIMTRHTAHILGEATKRSAHPDRLTIEASKEAEEDWTMRILQRAAWSAPVAICLPSYLNNEGTTAAGPEAMKMARGMGWPEGIGAYKRILEEWRDEGMLGGLVVA